MSADLDEKPPSDEPRPAEPRALTAALGVSGLLVGSVRRAPRPAPWMGWVIGSIAVLFLLPVIDGHVTHGVVLQGALYGTSTGLTALGLVLTYRASRIVNFAYGAMGALAATVAVELHEARGLPWIAAILLGVVLGGLLGLVIEVAVIRRFFTAPRLILTVATIGLAQVVGGLQLLVPNWIGGSAAGATSISSFSTFLSKTKFNVDVVVFHGDDVLLALAVPVVIAGLSFFLLKTDAGRAVRAVADNGDRALLLGIPIRRLSTLVWIIAGVMAALASTLAAPTQGLPISAGAGPTLLLPALAAAIIAKLESLPVAFGAGVGVGVLSQAVQITFPNRVALVDVALVVLILLTLLVRKAPRGRGNADDTGWASAGTVTPIPKALRRLPEVTIARAVVGIGVALAAILLPLGAKPGDVSIYTTTLIYAMVAVSLVVLSGWSGQVSLGQFSLVGVGGVVSGMLIQRYNVDLFLTLVLAAIAGGVVAALIGFPALRIKGFYLAVTTLAFAVAMDSYFFNPTIFASILPGNDSDHPLNRPVLFKRFPLESERAMYFLTLIILAVMIVVIVSLRGARTGRAMIATRDNERAAAAMAIPTTRVKLVGFVLSGAICGIAGGLQTLEIQSVGSGSFETSISILIFAMAVIGGISSIGGAITGVVLIQVLVHLFPKYALIITGSGLLTILSFLPGGLGAGYIYVRDHLLRIVARRHGLFHDGDPVDLLAAATETGAEIGGEDAVEDLADIRVARPAAVGRLGADEGADALLRCRDVQLSYGGTKILFGIDLDVYDGEVVALLGTNGAGKSTLLKAVTGLAAKSHGDVQFDGHDISKPKADALARSGVSMMPGGRGIFPSLTVRENLRLAAWSIRSDGAAVKDATARMLAMFPVLESRGDQTAGNMSGGEQQQLSLAMALMTRPKLLLIDELSLGLAPTVVGQLIEVVRGLNRDGITIVVVEQSVNVALELAERAVFLEKGQVRFSGRTAELLERPDVLRSVFIAGGAPDDAAKRPKKAELEARRERADALAEAPVVLSTDKVTLSFGGIKALRGIDLQLKKGEICGLIGHNGAGKTTLFDCISGFLVPDSGEVRLGRNAVGHLSATQRAWVGLGRSFQEARLYGALTVAETVTVALERHLASRDLVAAALKLPASTDSEDVAAERVAELLAMTGLTTYAERLIGELSTGTRRIVELACVLAQEPAVLLLDEPSGGVAQKETEALGPMLRRVQEQTGCSMLVIEHDMPLLSGLCDRLVAFELGEVIAEGPPSYVLEHPQVVASYLGTDDVAVNRSGKKDKTAPPKKAAGRSTRRTAKPATVDVTDGSGDGPDPASTAEIPAVAAVKRPRKKAGV